MTGKNHCANELATERPERTDPQGNVISGQQLALTARQYYEKQLGSLEKTINQANAR